MFLATPSRNLRICFCFMGLGEQFCNHHDRYDFYSFSRLALCCRATVFRLDTRSLYGPPACGGLRFIGAFDSAGLPLD